MDSDVIARLKELESKATAGPWHWRAGECGPQLEGDVKHPEMCPVLIAAGCENDGVTSGGLRGCLAWDVHINDPLRACPLHPKKDDRDFIAELRTHAKALIRAAELSEARRRVCEAATKHRATNYWCDAASGSMVLAVDDDTDRKLADALSALAALEAEGAGG